MLFLVNNEIQLIIFCFVMLTILQHIVLKLYLCCCSVAQSFPILCDPMDCSTPGLPVPHHFPVFAQVHVHCIGDAILWCPLLLPSIFPRIRDFSNESSVLIRWPKYWHFSLSYSSEYSGLTSLKIDWFDLLAVQGTLRSLLLHHSSKASILWCSAFFMAQLSQLVHDHWKTIALTIWTFVGRVISVCNQLQLQKYICCLSWMFPGLTSIWFTLYLLLSWTSAYTMAPLGVYMKYKE